MLHMHCFIVGINHSISLGRWTTTGIEISRLSPFYSMFMLVPTKYFIELASLPIITCIERNDFMLRNGTISKL